MAKSDLLKQAIADANAVKETALANAKIALQEAFRPRIESMLSAGLMRELDGEEELPAEAMPIDGEEMGNEEMPEDDFNAPESVGVGLDFDLDGDYDLSGNLGASEDEDIMAGDAENMNPEDEYGDDAPEDDLELESILRELDGDLEEPIDPMDDEMDDSMMGETMYESMHDEDDESIDDIIEAILREENLDGTEEPLDGTEEKLAEAEEELAFKEKELDEAYRTVKKLQSVINEVNLLNAKLLYTNKLFRNFELNETQKMKVIENFDRAGNTREVKLVFSTLAESFNRPRTKKKMVKESYASKPVRTTAPSKPILNEGFELAARWKKLAGLL